MATDYEKQWPTLRIDWARAKIDEWENRLQDNGVPIVEKRKIEHDLNCMKQALIDWEQSN